MACLVAVLGPFAGCTVPSGIRGPGGGSYPEACAQWQFSERRCGAIVDRAAADAEIDRAAVVEIALLPFDPNAGMEPGAVRLGGGQVALVRFTLADGGVVDQAVWCMGPSMTPACNEVAEIQTSTGVDHDVPCAGEPPAGCATLPPEPDQAAISAATPFTLAAIDVPLDRLGAYDIELGTATLPNGYLSERSFGVVDTQPDSFWIDGGVRLEIRPDAAGRPPIGSIYRDPFDGPEPVTIFLVFDVTDLVEPSVLRVRDVVVR